jgi:hypothetical protein
MFLLLIPEGNMLIFHFYTHYWISKKLKNDNEFYSGGVEFIRKYSIKSVPINMILLMRFIADARWL